MLIETINKTVNVSEYRDDPSMVALDPSMHANGGMINYLAGGGRPRLYDMQPRGTDTVPAMLTPGEFVVNADATAANLGLLHAINSGYKYAPAAAPAAPAAMGGFNGPAPMGDIYVQNPFTGEFLLAQVDHRVNAGIDGRASIAVGRMR
jgi:hypothetical protein